MSLIARLTALAAALTLASCAQLDRYQTATGITPGQTLTLAGDLLDTYHGLRRSNAAAQTSAKTAVNVQPVTAQPLPKSEAKEQGWLAGLRGAAMMLGLWK